MYEMDDIWGSAWAVSLSCSILTLRIAFNVIDRFFFLFYKTLNIKIVLVQGVSILWLK